MSYAGSRNLLLPSPSAHTPDNVSDVTRLLDAVERGEPQAAEELLPLVYEELRRLVTPKMANEKLEEPQVRVAGSREIL